MVIADPYQRGGELVDRVVGARLGEWPPGLVTVSSKSA